jgi:GDP-4-dehydro-6-deoxy-D-mannose reductase
MLRNPNEINLGYGDPYRNFLWIDDLIDLYEVILDNTQKAKGEIFCVGPDNAVTIKELVDIIARKLNWQGTVNWNTKPKRDGEIYVLNSTHAKAERMLGWSPKVSLDHGLDKIIELWKTKYENSSSNRRV